MTTSMRTDLGLAVVVAVALHQMGCSDDCDTDPRTYSFKSIDFHAWEKSGRTSCDPTKFSAGLTGGADKCPQGDATREYIITCSISVSRETGDRVDQATFLNYEPARDRCVYELRGKFCTR